MTVLKHYGTPRRSGRYPWGSGDDSYQRSTSLLGRIKKMEKEGLSEVDIAKSLGMTTSQLRTTKSNAKSEKRMADASMALRLKDKGLSNVAIGERMGLNESSVRALLDPALQERAAIVSNTADLLRTRVGERKFIDVGAGVETHLGVSRTKLDTAIARLQDEGYELRYVKVEQLGTGKQTWMKVLTPPEVPYSEVYEASKQNKIKSVYDYSEDGGRTLLGIETPRSISSERISIRYSEDGGSNKDGVIELRRGVDDISLGKSKYAQVRVAVDDTHYLKGMAIYADDLPDGIDVIYNTNKKRGTPSGDVFKKIKDDPDNPFGATIRQKHYVDADGKQQLSALNIVYEEGDWQKWSKNISSQVLSKQSPSLAKKQLGLDFDIRKEEYDEIMSLTNPVVKQTLLTAFSKKVDSAVVHLKAAALPRQASHVILPLTTVKENEIYAPNYDNGDTVVLIRHPHGGIFEIPQLTVNNKLPEARRIMENARDAVGIHPKTAAKLSGADFDGDTVLVIPNKKGLIRTAPSLDGLKDFDPKEAYPPYEGMKAISPRTKQLKMGDVSNLITDMTIKGANHNEIARAVRHSMVVIDAEKHKLNYKQSYLDNGIADLKAKYQGSERAGAATLISRASSEARVPHRKEDYSIDRETGKKVYKYTGETYTVTVPDKKGPFVIGPSGKRVYTTTKQVTKNRTSKTTKIEREEDAFALSSGTTMERVYAEHANKLKSLANQARKDSVSITPTPYSPSARSAYSNEVASLKSKLALSNRNKPQERQAQLLANAIVRAKRQANPDMDADQVKKIRGQALVEARTRVKAKKTAVEITNREWEAIQAGAVTSNILKQILLNTDMDALKQRAMPKTRPVMSTSRIARAKTMLDAGSTRAEVAQILGVSLGALDEVI